MPTAKAMPPPWQNYGKRPSQPTGPPPTHLRVTSYPMSQQSQQPPNHAYGDGVPYENFDANDHANVEWYGDAQNHAPDHAHTHNPCQADIQNHAEHMTWQADAQGNANQMQCRAQAQLHAQHMPWQAHDQLHPQHMQRQAEAQYSAEQMSSQARTQHPAGHVQCAPQNRNMPWQADANMSCQSPAFTHAMPSHAFSSSDSMPCQAPCPMHAMPPPQHMQCQAQAQWRADQMSGQSHVDTHSMPHLANPIPNPMPYQAPCPTNAIPPQAQHMRCQAPGQATTTCPVKPMPNPNQLHTSVTPPSMHPSPQFIRAAKIQKALWHMSKATEILNDMNQGDIK